MRTMKEGTLLYAGTSDRNYSDLAAIVNGSLWHLSRAVNVGEALALIKDACPQVIVAENGLGGAGWHEITGVVEAFDPRPNVIVCTDRTDDSTWRSILACGGFHLLATPFDELEVLRALDVAGWDWRRRNQASMAIAGG